eukprot:Tbor_TRINITY_DN4865_c0_g1::TRINITY_DN4865_c0_g1_i1::g.1382::m.1382
MSTNVLEVGLSSSGQPQLGKVWDGSNNLICHSLIDGWECAAGKASTLDESLAFSLARRAMGHAAAGDINMYRNLLVDDKDKKNYGIPAEEIKDGPNITTLSPYDNRIATPVEVIRILKSLKNRNDKYASQPAVTHVGAVQSSNLKILPSSQGKFAMGGEADSICLGEKFGILAPDARNGPYRFNEHRHHSSLLDPVLDVVVAPDCVTTKQIPRLDVPIYEQLLRVSSGNGKKGRRQSHQPTQSLEQQRYILSSFPSLRQLEQLRLSDRVRTSFAQSGTKGPHVTRYSGTYKMCVEPMDESYEDCLSLLPFPSDGLPSDPSLVWKKKRKKISKRSKS